jgi:hypothetical protein
MISNMENSKKISFSEQGQGDMLESVSGGKVKKILRAAVMAVGVVISPQVKTAENNQDMTEASRPVNYDAPKVTNSNGYTRPNIETYNYSPVSFT